MPHGTLRACSRRDCASACMSRSLSLAACAVVSRKRSSAASSSASASLPRRLSVSACRGAHAQSAQCVKTSSQTPRCRPDAHLGGPQLGGDLRPSRAARARRAAVRSEVTPWRRSSSATLRSSMACAAFCPALCHNVRVSVRGKACGTRRRYNRRGAVFLNSKAELTTQRWKANAEWPR